MPIPPDPNELAVDKFMIEKKGIPRDKVKDPKYNELRSNVIKTMIETKLWKPTELPI